MSDVSAQTVEQLIDKLTLAYDAADTDADGGWIELFNAIQLVAKQLRASDLARVEAEHQRDEYRKVNENLKENAARILENYHQRADRFEAQRDEAIALLRGAVEKIHGEFCGMRCGGAHGDESAWLASFDAQAQKDGKA